MKLQNQHDHEIQPFGTLRNLPITLVVYVVSSDGLIEAETLLIA